MAIFDPIELAAEVMAAFVANNAVTQSELPALFEGLHATIKRLVQRGEVASVVMEATASAVSIRKSITPDYLICLEDGGRFKSLRRHLAKLGMTPEQYRAKWGLPSTYPMVAPNFAAQRSALAKARGFGQLREKSVVAAPASVSTTGAVAPEPPTVAKSKVLAVPPEVPAKRKPGRPRKAEANRG